MIYPYRRTMLASSHTPRTMHMLKLPAINFKAILISLSCPLHRPSEKALISVTVFIVQPWGVHGEASDQLSPLSRAPLCRSAGPSSPACPQCCSCSIPLHPSKQSAPLLPTTRLLFHCKRQPRGLMSLGASYRAWYTSPKNVNITEAGMVILRPVQSKTCGNYMQNNGKTKSAAD